MRSPVIIDGALSHSTCLYGYTENWCQCLCVCVCVCVCVCSIKNEYLYIVVIIIFYHIHYHHYHLPDYALKVYTQMLAQVNSGCWD